MIKLYTIFRICLLMHKDNDLLITNKTIVIIEFLDVNN